MASYEWAIMLIGLVVLLAWELMRTRKAMRDDPKKKRDEPDA